MKTLTAVVLAALLFVGAQVVKADFVPADVTWMPSAIAPSFTFDTVLLTSYLQFGFGPGSSIAPDGHPSRVFSAGGYVDMSAFLLNGITTAIPSAGYPSGDPYSLYMSINVAGIAEGNGSAFFFSSNIPTVRMIIGPVATFINGIPNPLGALNPLAEGSFVTVEGGPAPKFSLTQDPLTGAPVVDLQFTTALAPLPPPFTVPFWISPGAGGLMQVSINGTTGTAVFLTQVPEPDRYGMLLLGLALIALLARRKKLKSLFR
ncbi:MAG: hypothetical protein JWN94_1132 [Betaproteobacteria bacterium]|nr:hypothetical protein [Betaproteobacteria bacterium]